MRLHIFGFMAGLILAGGLAHAGDVTAVPPDEDAMGETVDVPADAPPAVPCRRGHNDSVAFISSMQRPMKAQVMAFYLKNPKYCPVDVKQYPDASKLPSGAIIVTDFGVVIPGAEKEAKKAARDQAVFYGKNSHVKAVVPCTQQ